MARSHKLRASRVRGAAQASIEVTPQRIEQLFREAWPKAKQYPDLRASYSVAVAINVVRVARPPAKVAEPKIAIALKHARLLLRHLPVLRQGWEVERYNCEQLTAVFPSLTGNLENCAAVLDAIKQTERCVRVLVEATKPVRPPQPNPATFIAHRVRQAWSGVRGAIATQSDKPGAPLCTFIRDALALADVHYELDTVSDMLRERHRRPRPARSKETRA